VTAPALPPQPPNAPTASDVANQVAFDKLVASQLTDVQASAAKWQAGLAAFVTLVGAGLILKGPEKASDLSHDWRIVLTIFAGGGLVLAVWALWAALRASAGTPGATSLQEIQSKYGSVDALRAQAAVGAAEDLRLARNLMVVALLLIGSGVFLSWYATGESKTPSISVKTGNEVVCGTVKSADEQQLVVKVDGESKERTIAFGDVKNLTPVASCKS
jgi:hypothetical protein